MSERRRRWQVGWNIDLGEEDGVWAYAYQIVPPLVKRRLVAIQGFLDHEQAAARNEGRTWASRLVSERGATRILIVSDRPDPKHGVDGTLAAELEREHMLFTCTVPLEILEEPPPV